MNSISPEQPGEPPNEDPPETVPVIPQVPLSPPVDSGEITIFLSYARDDESVYQMIQPFKKLLTHFIYAKSGRKVRAFIDQNDIRWGEIWRETLDTEILAASVFIPLLSASYLDSNNCRMEFNKFQANSSAIGVKELLLPVLLINSPAIFHENSTDDVVREAAARQWEVIEDAVLADQGSSAWKVTMARLADRFVESYEAAETTLASLGDGDLDGSAASASPDESLSEDDGPGIAELAVSMDVEIKALTTTGKDMGLAIRSLGEAATSAGRAGDHPTPQKLQAWSLRAAQAFKAPSLKISTVGEEMFRATKALDSDIHRLRRIAIDLLPTDKSFANSYNSTIGALEGLDTVSAQLNHLLEQMKPAEHLSVPFRKSLRPARRGLTRVTDSLRLIESWEKIDV